MTDDNKKFVRDIFKHRRLCFNANRISLPVEQMDYLLTLLIESEAMREKAEHRLATAVERGPLYCIQSCFCKNDSDWIDAARKEISG